MDGVENETLTQTRTPTTRKSLLDDLAQNPDSERLDEFARLYEPVMRRYAMRAQARLRYGLSEADRDDLVQEAFIAVRRALAQFRYDPAKGKFRNYLSLTIRNLAWRFQRKSAATRLADSETLATLAEAGDGAQSDAETRELMLSVWSVAYALVVAKRGFTPITLAIFRSHVLEDNPITHMKRSRERIGADRITRQTGRSAEPIRVRCCPIFHFTFYIFNSRTRRVRHLYYIRHVAGGARIKDSVGDPIRVRRLNFKHARFQRPRIEGDGFARFQIDRQVRVSHAEVVEQRNQSVHIVVRARDVMATAKVDPLHLR